MVKLGAGVWLGWVISICAFAILRLSQFIPKPKVSPVYSALVSYNREGTSVTVRMFS